MIDVYVLDGNLKMIGMIESYKSLIWANRYFTVGDCELYLTASNENISLLSMGRYLMRSDDNMVCVIKKIEIDTNAQNGNYLIVTGYDVKSFLDQRIIWDTLTTDGNTEDFVRTIIQNSVTNPADEARQFKKENGNQLVFLGDKANFTEVITEQVSYKNVGEKIREYCKTYGWGYRFVLNDENLYFQLYAGTDRSSSVFFSDQYENLASTKYINDDTHLGNVALIGGVGEGMSRLRNALGVAESVSRYEIFVDAKDISKTITWKELTQVYPTTEQGGLGEIYEASGKYYYRMRFFYIQILDDFQLAWLKSHVYGTEVVIDGILYYRASRRTIADLETGTPDDNSTVVIRDILYYVYLWNRGIQAFAEYGEKTSFEGSTIPNVTFTYKQDYFLGDIVNIENEYGISANARIIEVVEVVDDNGHSVEPKFEYLTTAK